MYYIDSHTFRIDVFDFDAGDGSILGRRQFASIDRLDGTPDGIAVDDEGGVWLALYGGSAVRRYTPDGSLDRVVAVPAENVTACCFGGDDGRTLFITTAAPAGQRLRHRRRCDRPTRSGVPQHGAFRRRADERR